MSVAELVQVGGRYRCHRGCGFQAGSGSSGCHRHGADYRRCPDYQSYVQDVGTLKVTEERRDQRIILHNREQVNFGYVYVIY